MNGRHAASNETIDAAEKKRTDSSSLARQFICLASGVNDKKKKKTRPTSETNEMDAVRVTGLAVLKVFRNASTLEASRPLPFPRFTQKKRRAISSSRGTMTMKWKADESDSSLLLERRTRKLECDWSRPPSETFINHSDWQIWFNTSFAKNNAFVTNN